MDIRQWVINLTAKLRKQYPEQDGAYAIVFTRTASPGLDEGFQGDPMADNRPDFVKKDEAGWVNLTNFTRK